MVEVLVTSTSVTAAIGALITTVVAIETRKNVKSDTGKRLIISIVLDIIAVALLMV